MKRARPSVFVVAALITVLAPLSALAESKSWSAIKGTLPGDMFVVAGGNIATIQKSSIYQTFVPALIAKEPDAKKTLEDIKAACGIDLMTAVTDLTIAVQENEKGIIVAALNGIDEAKVTSCLQKMAEKEKKKVTSKKSGKVIEYTMEGDQKKLYVAWLGRNVLALATEPDQRTELDRLMGGKGLSGDLAKAVGGVKTDAAVWFAVAKKTPAGQAGTMRAIHGTVDVAGGVLSVDARILMSSAAEAKALADEANKEMARNAGQMPPDLAKVLKSVKIGASGDEVTVKLSMTEKEALGVLGLMMTQM